MLCMVTVMVVCVGVGALEGMCKSYGGGFLEWVLQVMGSGVNGADMVLT